MLNVWNIMKWAAISAWALLVVLVFFGESVLRLIFHDFPFMGKSFNNETWSSALVCKSDEECVAKEMACIRGPMYRDLQRNHLIVGTSKTDVMELIGRPTRGEKHDCFDYELGHCSGLKVDADYLRICFDEDEKVKKVFHWQS